MNLAADQTPIVYKARSNEMRHRDLAAGATLFRQGDPAVAVYVIERGQVALVRHTSEGRRVTLFTAGPGESFAEAALFSNVYLSPDWRIKSKRACLASFDPCN